MKNNKEKFRLMGILNPADMVIVAGIVVLVWAAMVFSAPQQASAKPGDIMLSYTIELKEKEAGFHEKIEPGAKVYDSERGYELGVITAVYALPYREDVADEANGIIRRTIVDGLEFTYIVVEAVAQVSTSATTVGQYEVMVNKEVFVKSKKFAGKGYITAMETKP